MDEVTEQIILGPLRSIISKQPADRRWELQEDPEDCWWVRIVPGEAFWPLDVFELTADLKWIQFRRQDFGGEN
jgi:hypothetical protein